MKIFSGWNGQADRILIDLKNWEGSYSTWDDLGLRVAVGHIAADVSSTRDDAGTENTAIYYTHGTTDTGDDTLIILLEDYTTLDFAGVASANDIIIAFDGAFGTTGDDILVGGAGANTLFGRHGSDIIYGGGGGMITCKKLLLATPIGSMGVRGMISL